MRARRSGGRGGQALPGAGRHGCSPGEDNPRLDRRANHRWDRGQFHPDFPVQDPLALWTWDGTFPPKLLQARYGEPIMTGLRKRSTSLMLEGAVPAALMALSGKLIFELAEKYVVPKALRS